MKLKLFTFFTIVALACACTTKDDSPKIVISGTWEDGANKEFYIVTKDKDDENGISKFVNTDTIKVKPDNTFGISKKIEKIGEILYLSVNGKRKEFIASPDSLMVNIRIKDTLNRKGKPYTRINIDLKGGHNQAIFEEGENIAMGSMFMQLGIMLELSKANKENNKARMDSLRIAYDTIQVKFKKRTFDFLDSTNNSIAAPYFIEKALLNKYPFDTTMFYYNRLSDVVKNSYAGTELKKKLDQRAQVSVGGIPADFELPTPDGGKITLSSLRGKVVLLDFWATWCGPCKREIPNMRNVYAKYHDKGFEILSISVDKAKDKDKWLELIKSEGMTWLHGSSLDDMDGVVAKQFGITAIPQFFLLNKNGKIVAAGMDIRGEGLDPAVEKALSE